MIDYAIRGLFFGGGWSNFKTHCGFLFYCNNYNSMFVTHCFDDKIVCTECGEENVIPYGDDKLPKPKYFIPFVSGYSAKRELDAPCSKNLCLKCKKFTLNFEVTRRND